MDNTLKRKAKAPKPPLKGTLRAVYCKVIIQKRFLACPGLFAPSSVEKGEKEGKKIKLFFHDNSGIRTHAGFPTRIVVLRSP